MKKYAWAVAYVAVIVIVNVMFGYGPKWALFANVLVGAGFLVRDMAQRDLGDRVLFATGAGIVVSWVMADPAVVWPSTLAFAVSEVADWGIVRRLRSRPMWVRMTASHAVSVPLDSLLFLGGLAYTGIVPWSAAGFWRMNGFKALALIAVALKRPK